MAVFCTGCIDDGFCLVGLSVSCFNEKIIPFLPQAAHGCIDKLCSELLRLSVEFHADFISADRLVKARIVLDHIDVHGLSTGSDGLKQGYRATSTCCILSSRHSCNP
ncbi:hypothetical protein SDC9_174444 [bioreactor metagenome]|uniref:Uncharacterized protein n=1 Tax=bioreactor metagenome TaxID=1076179 RepID=A0A645GJD6_9ZZZZ